MRRTVEILMGFGALSCMLLALVLGGLLTVPSLGPALMGCSEGLRYRILEAGSASCVVSHCGGGCRGDVVVPERVIVNGRNCVVVGVDRGAFDGCAELTSVHLPRTVVDVDVPCFLGCSALRSVTCSVENPRYTSVHGSLVELGTGSLVQWPTGVSGECLVPDCVIRLGAWSLAGSRVSGLRLHHGVHDIGEAALRGCENLHYALLHGGLESVGAEAFAGCRSLERVEFGPWLRQIGWSAFEGCDKLLYVELPASSECYLAEGAFEEHTLVGHGELAEVAPLR